VTIGSKAPYFSLQSYQGENINSSDTADNPLVITFWSTWNSESIDQVKIFDDYQLGISNKNKDMSARIILVNSQESKEVVSNIMRRGNYDLEVLLDQNGEVSNLYGVHTLPTTFFIDRSGDIVEIFTGTMNKNELINKMEGIIF
jgi:peroxiredoxin